MDQCVSKDGNPDNRDYKVSIYPCSIEVLEELFIFCFLVCHGNKLGHFCAAVVKFITLIVSHYHHHPYFHCSLLQDNNVKLSHLRSGWEQVHITVMCKYNTLWSDRRRLIAGNICFSRTSKRRHYSKLSMKSFFFSCSVLFREKFHFPVKTFLA